MNKYKVRLTEVERDFLKEIVNKGKERAKKITHARILLQVDQSKEGLGLRAKEVAKNLQIHERTVHRVRQRFIEEGLESALNRKKHSRFKPRQLDGDQEAKLIALCCSSAPEGQVRWTLSLLKECLIKLDIVEKTSRSTVHRVLKKMNLNLG